MAECTINYAGNRKGKKAFSAILVITLFSLIVDFLLSYFITGKGDELTFSLTKFIWPFLSALFLYVYLFIMLKENKTDSLTGLDNRYSFFEYIGRISRNKSGDSWSIAMLDINNFKSINDIYGHLEGDNALLNLARAIKKCSKKSDFTARYGGDEFILVAKTETGINDFISNIENELTVYNDASEKLYNIEISYGFDTFQANGNRPINEFLVHIDKLMHKNNEEKRRAGDRI
ncbi:MAG: GGDEF domain-containing protein [Treponema sp.]|nr:GGDEF domain-containing protein [Treponema sp.]MCL2236881.1 GGDEF domain-containing protein [Treponema sp.]